jgi:hypothetical protein
MEEEDQAVFSEVKIEMDVAEPAYWTTQQWTQEQCQGESAALSAGFVLSGSDLGNTVKPVKIDTLQTGHKCPYS